MLPDKEKRLPKTFAPAKFPLWILRIHREIRLYSIHINLSLQLADS